MTVHNMLYSHDYDRTYNYRQSIMCANTLCYMHTWSLFRSWYQTRSLYFIGFIYVDHRGRSIVVKAASVACVRISCFFCLGILTYIQCVYILYYSECRPNMEEFFCCLICMDVDERPCKREVFQADFEGFSYKKAFFFPGLVDGIWDSPSLVLQRQSWIRNRWSIAIPCVF